MDFPTEGLIGLGCRHKAMARFMRKECAENCEKKQSALPLTDLGTFGKRFFNKERTSFSVAEPIEWRQAGVGSDPIQRRRHNEKGAIRSELTSTDLHGGLKQQLPYNPQGCAHSIIHSAECSRISRRTNTKESLDVSATEIVVRVGWRSVQNMARKQGNIFEEKLNHQG